jgi:hypothetical protein
VTDAPTPPTDWGADVAFVDDLLGPSVDFAADPLADAYVDTANTWAWRKRIEAGYDDTDPTAPTPADVIMGCGLYAVALYRERASTDSFPSFEDFPGATLTGGSMGQIKRLLGIPKGRVDATVALPAGTTAVDVMRRRRSRLWLVR